MKTKQLLALGLGLIAIQASASTQKKFITPSQNISFVNNNAVITLGDMPDFSKKSFTINVSPDGKFVHFTAKSHKRVVKTPITKKGWFGRTIHTTEKTKHYDMVDLTVDLEGKRISSALAGATFTYENNQRYFSMYDSDLHNTVVITLPLER